jgi:hypothetical protein
MVGSRGLLTWSRKSFELDALVYNLGHLDTIQGAGIFIPDAVDNSIKIINLKIRVVVGDE